MKQPLSEQQAVALVYAANDAAPRVLAKGRGMLAEQIIANAQAHGVYVHQSSALVTLLMQLDLDQHIPDALYQVVAEILAWLYQMESDANGADSNIVM